MRGDVREGGVIDLSKGSPTFLVEVDILGLDDRLAVV